MNWRQVRAENLRPGMVIYPEAKKSNRGTKLKSVTGHCEHGVHYGTVCVDALSTWWVCD